MKTLLLFLTAACAAGLSACASSSAPQSPNPSADATRSSQVWRLDHELTGRWRAENPQSGLEQQASDASGAPGGGRAIPRRSWVIEDAILKLSDTGVFQAHLMVDHGTGFTVRGDWVQQTVADGTRIELDPHPASQHSHLPFSPNDFVDSGVLLVDESNQRMQMLLLGQPDIILTPIP